MILCLFFNFIFLCLIHKNEKKSRRTLIELCHFVLAAWLNNTRIYNSDILATIIDTKPKDIPLLTLSNHHSCFDDPGIWGKLLAFMYANCKQFTFALNFE